MHLQNTKCTPPRRRDAPQNRPSIKVAVYSHKNTGFQIEIRCFSNFRKRFLGPPKSVGFILGFTGNEPKIENRENRTFLNILKFDAERNSQTRGLCSFLFRLGIPPGKHTGTDISSFGFGYCYLMRVDVGSC